MARPQCQDCGRPVNGKRLGREINDLCERCWKQRIEDEEQEGALALDNAVTDDAL